MVSAVRTFVCSDCSIVGEAGPTAPLPIRCKDCKRAVKAAKARARYEANRAELLERQRDWRKANPEARRAQEQRHRERHPDIKKAKDARYYARYRAQVRERNRARHHANKEVRNAYSRNQYEKTIEERRRYRRSHYEANRSAYVSAAAARRALTKGATLEKVERSVVWERDRGICHICGLPADKERWDLDHIVPLSKGGPHAYANVAVSHPICNRRKWDKLKW